LSLSVADGALAASSAVRASTGGRARMVVLDGRVWRCDAAVCRANGQGRSQGLARECARVARKLGPLAAYSRDGVVLQGADLDRCNREARLR
jgi:hypothetical protein